VHNPRAGGFGPVGQPRALVLACVTRTVMTIGCPRRWRSVNDSQSAAASHFFPAPTAAAGVSVSEFQRSVSGFRRGPRSQTGISLAVVVIVLLRLLEILLSHSSFQLSMVNFSFATLYGSAQKILASNDGRKNHSETSFIGRAHTPALCRPPSRGLRPRSQRALSIPFKFCSPIEKLQVG